MESSGLRIDLDLGGELARKAAQVLPLGLDVDLPGLRPDDLSFHLQSGGGGVSTAGTLELSGSVAQPVVDDSFGNAHDLQSGFWHAILDPVSATPGDSPNLPSADRLGAPYPNPFNPSTTIRFELAARGPVRVRVFDAQGRLIRDLVHGEYPAGRHEVIWDGRDDQGGGLSSGVYFLRYDTAEYAATKKMTLLK